MDYRGFGALKKYAKRVDGAACRPLPHLISHHFIVSAFKQMHAKATDSAESVSVHTVSSGIIDNDAVSAEMAASRKNCVSHGHSINMVACATGGARERITNQYPDVTVSDQPAGKIYTGM